MNENLSTSDIDISNLTLEQCQKLLKDLPKRILKLEKERDLLVFKELEQVANNFGIKNVDDFFKNYSTYKENLNFKKLSPKRSRKIKYINPYNSSQTWTGVGIKPNWLEEGIKNNIFTLEDCLVKENNLIENQNLI